MPGWYQFTQSKLWLILYCPIYFQKLNVLTVQSLTYPSVGPYLMDFLVWTSSTQYINDYLRLNVCHSRLYLCFHNVSEKTRVIYLFRRQSRKCPFTHTHTHKVLRGLGGVVCHSLTPQHVPGRPWAWLSSRLSTFSALNPLCHGTGTNKKTKQAVNERLAQNGTLVTTMPREAAAPDAIVGAGSRRRRRFPRKCGQGRTRCSTEPLL